MALRGFFVLVVGILFSGCGSLLKMDGKRSENLSRNDCSSVENQIAENCNTGNTDSEVANYRAQNY